MRTIVMGLVLATSMGCATVGNVGVNTTGYRFNADNCGQHGQVPNNLAQFKGTMPSPNSATASDEQMPPKSSMHKGKYRVVVADVSSPCNGVRVYDLTEEKDVEPAAAGTKMHKFKAELVKFEDWNQ